jgi:hypothetical protein
MVNEYQAAVEQTLSFDQALNPHFLYLLASVIGSHFAS